MAMTCNTFRIRFYYKEKMQLKRAAGLRDRNIHIRKMRVNEFFTDTTENEFYFPNQHLL